MDERRANWARNQRDPAVWAPQHSALITRVQRSTKQFVLNLFQVTPYGILKMSYNSAAIHAKYLTSVTDWLNKRHMRHMLIAHLVGGGGVVSLQS